MSRDGNNGDSDHGHRAEVAFRAVVEAAPFGMHFYRLDEGGRLVFTGGNPAADRILRVDNATFVGKTIEEAFPPLASTEVPDRYRAAARDGAPWHTEQISYDHGRVVGAFEVYAFQTAPGEMAAAFQDISARKAAEEALRRSEARFRALIGGATDIIVVLDREGRFKFWSPSATEVLGWTETEVLGRNAFEFIHPDDHQDALSLFVGNREVAGAVARITSRYRHADGSWRLIEAVGRNLLEDPAVEGVVINSRDVTEQRRLEEHLRQAQKLDAIGQLAGGVAHDFNNLLTVVLSCSESLRQGMDPSSPGFEEVEEIRDAGERARDLTRRLLAFARKQVIAPVQVDLTDLVRTSEKLLRRVLREDIELVVDTAPGLRPVRCDPGQMEQVLMNLAVNARDAMPDGGTLRIRVEKGCPQTAVAAERDRWVHLSVEDSGCGMSPEVRARAFEPFFTSKPPGQGTGLGLATVYGIVSQSGGHIHLESEPGKGTSFWICMPLSPTERAPLAPEPALPSGAPGGGETILVIEDDPHVRAVTTRALAEAGYRVRVARNGQEALAGAAAATESVHLAITDVILPGQNGRAVADELRLRWPGLRVLYVSGYPQQVISKAGVLEPGVDFLPKPFTPSALVERVRRILGRDD